MRSVVSLVTCLSLSIGCHFSAGPVFGLVVHDSREDPKGADPPVVTTSKAPKGLSAGLEIGGGYLLGKVNVGVQIRSQMPELTYFVLEGFHGGRLSDSAFGGGGATIGVGYSRRDGVSLVAGGFVAAVATPTCNYKLFGWMNATYSVALGYRYSGGIHEIYVTPKIGASSCLKDKDF